MSRIACLALSALLLIPILYAFWKCYPELIRKRTAHTKAEISLLLVVLIFGWFFVYGIFIVGQGRFAYRDLGLDTVDLYVPFYLDLLDSISAGTFSVWNYAYGLGASVMSYQSWLLDPFNVILIPLGLLLGSGHLSFVLVLVQGAKIVAAGVLFDFLATRYCETPLARMIGSACYAFCGFLMLWGQHYWLGSASVLFVLLLLALERLMELWSAGRFVGVALATALCVAWSPYIGFMVLFCAAIYSLLRLIYVAPKGRVLRSVLLGTVKLLIPVCCGCLIACATLVPYAMYLFGETARTSAAGSSTFERAVSYAAEFIPFGWIPLILSRFLGQGLITTGAAYPEGLVAQTVTFPYVNSYEVVSLGFGSLSLIVLGQFAAWTRRDAPKRAKVLIIIAAAIVALYCLNCFLPALLNVFVAPKYRSSFALAVPVCLAMAVGWEKRVQTRSVNRVALVIGFALTAMIIAWSFIHTVDGRWFCAAAAAIATAFAALVALYKGRASDRVFGLAGGCLLVMAVLLDGYAANTNRAYCTQADFPGASKEEHADTYRAFEFVSHLDDSFYRVDKTYDAWTRYNDSLIIGYHGITSYNSTGSDALVRFYERLWPHALGSDGATQDYREDAEAFRLASWLGVKYLISDFMQPESQFELIGQFGNKRVFLNKNVAPLLVGYDQTISESRVDSMGSDEERRNIVEQAVIVPDDVAGSVSAAVEKSGLNSIKSSLELADDQSIRGSFESAVDSVACLKVPYANGWHIYIDGEERDIFCADYGFIGFEVEGGTHSIEARYELPGSRTGLMLAGAGVILCISSCVLGEALISRSRKAPSIQRSTQA